VAVGTRARGAVLCPPLGYEYVRAHRALRRLAEELAERGCHAFRLDYYGTGDSSGESEEASVAQCIASVRHAIEELKENAMIDTVCVVGLRLGAAFGVLASEGRGDIERLVLWDPVERGPRRMHGSEGPTCCIGVEDLDLLSEDCTPKHPVLVVSSADPGGHRELVSAWRARNVELQHERFAIRGRWDEVSADGAVLLPAEAIGWLASRIAGTER
jgi:dienelactone hydrolase